MQYPNPPSHTESSGAMLEGRSFKVIGLQVLNEYFCCGQTTQTVVHLLSPVSVLQFYCSVEFCLIASPGLLLSGTPGTLQINTGVSSQSLSYPDLSVALPIIDNTSSLLSFL